MEQQQQTKGEGKESQLSRIAAAVNPASQTEANPEATKSMISTFIKHFDSVALELINEMDDDQEKLVKKMVDEITKLQTKNIEEFQKAIGKIVGIANNMIESNNPKLQEMGQGLKDQATSELFKAKGISLTGEKDTFMNRLGRQIGMNTEEEPIKGRQGIGKIAKSAFSNIGRDLKRGVGIAVGADIEQEGTFYDRVIRSDEEKRTRELSRLEQSSNETKSESLTETFKRSIEELIQEAKKSDTPEDKPKKPDTSSPVSESDSEEQEDRAGISKDATITALEKTSESNLIIQQNTTESTEILGKLLEEVKKIAELMVSNQGSGGDSGGGGFMPDFDLPDRRRGNRGRGTRPRSVRGRARLARMRAGSMGRTALSAAGSAGRGALGLAARAAVPLTIAYGAYDAVTGYQGAAANEEAQNAEIDKKVASGELTQEQAVKAKSDTKKQGRVEKTKAVGGGVGMAGGALAGAALGATVGSIVPGVGTVIGGAVGGVVGGIAGSSAGSWLGEKAGQLTNWWQGDGDKAKIIDEKVKKGEISKAEGDKLKKDLQPSGKDKVVGGLKTAAKFGALGPIGMAGAALFGGGDDAKPKSKAEKKEGGMLSKIGNFMGENKGMMAGAAALGPIGMLGGALYDKMSGSSAKTETGRNVDSAIIEAGTKATKDKMVVNVPPPTVITQGSQGAQQSGPTITAPGGVRNVRSDDPTWLRFQHRRAVA